MVKAANKVKALAKKAGRGAPAGEPAPKKAKIKPKPGADPSAAIVPISAAGEGSEDRSDRKVAKERLKEWEPELDPSNEAHIDAFLACRLQASKEGGGRVHKAHVLKMIAKQKEFRAHESVRGTSFCEVPRANFGGVLPAALQPYLIALSQLREHFEVHDPEETFDDVFILDERAKRAGVDLGPMVGKLTFQTRTGRSSSSGGTGAGPRPKATAQPLMIQDAAPLVQNAPAASQGAVAQVQDAPERRLAPDLRPEEAGAERRLAPGAAEEARPARRLVVNVSDESRTASQRDNYLTV